MNPDPTDDDLFNALRNYLSTQDLMTVTKKSVSMLRYLAFILLIDMVYSFQDRKRGNTSSVPQG